jgi:hypothetical protein
MGRITRSFRKEMLRAFGMTDALLELAHLSHADRPDFVVNKKTYTDAHRLVTEGVHAARAGRRPRDSQRKSVSFMLGYKNASGAIVPSQGTTDDARLSTDTIAPSANGDRTLRDEHGLNLRRGRAIPTYDSPEAMAGECTGLLSRDVNDQATVEELAETILLNAEAVQEGPGPEEHPAVAKLWRGIIKGWNAARAGEPAPSSASLAVMVGYEFGQREAGSTPSAPATAASIGMHEDSTNKSDDDFDFSPEPDEDDR